MAQKVVLAYSGGLDTSAIIPWLVEQVGCEVVAFVGDVGQGEQELEGIEAKALASGAGACFVVDLRDEFVEDYVLPSVMAGAVYEGRYLLGTAMARPVLAKAQVELARRVGADALAHGCTGKGNDQVRFESAFASLAPDLEVIAPWRVWSMRGRDDLLAYLADRGIACSASAEKIYSRDRNLWHVSHEGGSIEDPFNHPPEDAWMLSRPVEQTPDAPGQVMLSFRGGRPTSLDGRAMSPRQILERLNAIGSLHGVGRVDMVENRLVGIKSRGLYETPGGTILFEALRALEEIVYDRDALRWRQRAGLDFAELLYTGKWFTPTREAIWAGVRRLAGDLTGDVVVRLFKGQAMPVARRSPNSLYDANLATFDDDGVYSHADAGGFIRLWSLPQRVAASRKLADSEAPA